MQTDCETDFYKTEFAKEKEFFGFHPAVLVDDIANAAVDYACDCIDEIEDVLLKDVNVQKIEGHQELIAKVELDEF